MIWAYSAATAMFVLFEGLALFTLLRLDGRVGYAGGTLVALVGVVVCITVFVRTRIFEMDRRRQISASTLPV